MNTRLSVTTPDLETVVSKDLPARFRQLLAFELAQSAGAATREREVLVLHGLSAASRVRPGLVEKLAIELERFPG